MKNIWFYKTPIGKIGIASENETIIGILFENSKIIENAQEKETPIIKKCHQQLMEYFNQERTHFNLPLAINGTDFQNKVWNALMDIPYGSTCSYKDIALKINNEKAVRAVGLANNKNYIPIIIPCHRVIGTSGKLVGYAGGLEMKQYLLDLEKTNADK